MYVSLKGDLHQEPSVKICASVKAVTMHQPWLTTSLMEWNALHAHWPGSGGLAAIISVTASLLGVKLVQAVWMEREELLIEHFGR